MKKSFLYIALLLMFTACGNNEDTTLDMAGMFSPNGPTITTRFAQSMHYNDSVGEIHLDMGADDYTVYACTDSHITRKSHRNLDYFMHTYEDAQGPKLALHFGDLIDAQKNFPCADSVLRIGGRAKEDTLFLAVGNHDVYFKQWEIYRSYFKTSVYWFDTRNGDKPLDLFICLDTSEGTLGPDQMNWLRDVLATKSQEGYRRIIVFTHTHVWKLDGSQGHTSNFATEETYELCSLLSKYGVEFMWSGHQHSRQSVIFKGVNFLVLDSTKDSEPGTAYATIDMGEHVIFHYHDYPKE
ncbi:MAG: metallophosphoesterase [Paludibacteraceae bacterium]|nr:metallophosphoesterase [Paludibacteraceae bacterium]